MTNPQPETGVLERQLHEELVRASDNGPPASFLLDDVLAAGIRRRRLRRARTKIGYATAVAAVGATVVMVPNSQWFSSGTARLATPGVEATPDSSDFPDEYSRSIEDQLADLAASLNISEPPDVDIVRLVTPEERGELVEPCMAERGYSADVLEDVGIPAERADAYNLAQYVCMAKYPVDDALTRQWSDVQVGIQYDWTINNVIPCLVERGYTITDVPSREEFIATYYTAAFYPYEQISEPLTNAQREALNRACPQTAPSELLWTD